MLDFVAHLEYCYYYGYCCYCCLLNNYLYYCSRWCSYSSLLAVSAFIVVVDLGLAAYNAALEASKSIDYKNPIKLGLALNLSVFYYEVVANKEEACKLAKETLDKAKDALAGVDEDDDEAKDAMNIVNLLQENLDMWNSEDDE